MNSIKNKIFDGRAGGQSALRGYDYQTLLSAYLVLKNIENENSYLRLEGFEDIDQFIIGESEKIVYTQIKFSKNKQDSSFMKDILKNFLEVYLIENKVNIFFQLIYDFEVAKGNLSKLIENPMNLNYKIKEYWKNQINKIKKENPTFAWENYNFDDFISRLIFTNSKKENIVKNIRKTFITKYEITSGNENLYVNGIYNMCFEKMKNRDIITYKDLVSLIQDIKDDISKGKVNKAINWITKINFDAKKNGEAAEYYRGKKAEISDIINGYPVIREGQEKYILDSINENDITVIKSSSGQGKTTLLWRVSYLLKNDYFVYNISNCSNEDDVGDIIQYLKGRISVGENILLVLDNLNLKLKAWNRLAMRMKEEIGCNYKIVLTTRENDWYHFAGDQSILRNIEIIDLSLKREEAEEIYNKLSEQGHIKKDIHWQAAWEMVEEKALLIEYIYLLTQGDMLSNRIEAQIKSISGNKQEQEVKKFVLRHIGFIDMYEIKLNVSMLSKKVRAVYGEIDLTNIFKSIEDEFHIIVRENHDYIAGLHPVRSQHISNVLHEYNPIEDTILSLIDVVDEEYIAIFFSNILIELEYIDEEFYSELVKDIANKSYNYLFEALKGVFSGTILKYYHRNKNYFNEANNLLGLELFLMEINPFARFEEFNTSIDTLTELLKIEPENKNIKELIKLSNKIEQMDLFNTDIYIFCYYLHQVLKKDKQIKIKKEGYANIVYWLIKIDKNFSLLDTFSFEDVLKNEKEWSLKSLNLLMLSWYILDPKAQLKFSKEYKLEIFSRLKRELNLVEIYEEDSNIISRYISTDLDNLNDKSVSRIDSICKTLPMYKKYCIKAIKPEMESLKELYYIPDEDIKEMPRENVILSFHKEFVEIWNNSILTLYDFKTAYEYLYHWLNIRKRILLTLNLSIDLYELKYKKGRITSGKGREFDNLIIEIQRMKNRVGGYPLEHKPFIKEVTSISQLIDSERYFIDIENFFKQFGGILKGKDNHKVRSATLNLQNAFSNLKSMQQSFYYEANKLGHLVNEHKETCQFENNTLRKIVDYTLFFNTNRNTSKKFIDPRIVNSWIRDYWRNYFIEIEESIINIEDSDFHYTLPQSLIYEGVLKKLPIIVESKFSLIFNPEEFLQSIIPLVYVGQKDINYIIVMSKEKESNNIEPLGFRFKIDFFKQMENELNEKEFDYEGLAPYHVAITAEILNVFDQNFSIGENIIEDNYSSVVEELILKLWEYSMFNNYFKIITKEDEVYFNLNNDKYIYEIDMLKDNIKQEDITKLNLDKLLSLSNRVLKGDYLNNNEFNIFLNNYNILE